MTPPVSRTPRLYRTALALAALHLPTARREDWLAEWLAELWYVAGLAPGTAASTLPSRLERHRRIALFCFGAVADARCLRVLHAPATPHRVSGTRLSSSAARTAFALAAVATLAGVLAAMLPNVRSSIRPELHLGAARTVTIWPLGAGEPGTPLLPLRRVRAWQRRPQHLFRDFAFYQPVRKPVHIGSHQTPELLVARASGNLLDLLDARVTHAPPSSPMSDTLPQLILSESAWRTHFAARTDLFGATLRVGLQTARLTGVVSDTTAPTSIRPDAWLLLPEALAGDLAGNVRVFALARLDPAAEPALHPAPRWHMSVPAAADDATDFLCVAAYTCDACPGRIFCFAVALALLSLPAITSVSLGDYTRHPLQLSPAAAPRRWLFLVLKIALLLPAVWFVSLDVAFALPFRSPETPRYLLCATAFLLTLFGLRWAIADQRRRCPLCLRTLTCPARVGEPSRNFLSWNGTELICAEGHGLLHVPELPTSWFSHPRWLTLDPSWHSLFLPAV